MNIAPLREVISPHLSFQKSVPLFSRIMVMLFILAFQNLNSSTWLKKEIVFSTRQDLSNFRTVQVYHCMFINCKSFNSGGALFLSSNTNLTLKLDLCDFLNCSALQGSGGAIYTSFLTNSTISLESVCFFSCSCTTTGYAISSYQTGQGHVSADFHGATFFKNCGIGRSGNSIVELFFMNDDSSKSYYFEKQNYSMNHDLINKDTQIDACLTINRFVGDIKYSTWRINDNFFGIFIFTYCRAENPQISGANQSVQMANFLDNYGCNYFFVMMVGTMEIRKCYFKDSPYLNNGGSIRFIESMFDTKALYFIHGTNNVFRPSISSNAIPLVNPICNENSLFTGEPFFNEEIYEIIGVGLLLFQILDGWDMNNF